VVIPPNPGVLSSLGLMVTPQSVHLAQTDKQSLADVTMASLREKFTRLEQDARSTLALEEDSDRATTVTYKVDMRYEGQAFEIELSLDRLSEATKETITTAFERQYEAKYGLVLDRPLEIVSLKLELEHQTESVDILGGIQNDSGDDDPLIERRDVYFPEYGEFIETPFLDRTSLTSHTNLEGPTIIEDSGSTTVVGPNASISMDANRNLLVRRDQ